MQTSLEVHLKRHEKPSCMPKARMQSSGWVYIHGTILLCMNQIKSNVSDLGRKKEFLCSVFTPFLLCALTKVIRVGGLMIVIQISKFYITAEQEYKCT